MRINNNSKIIIAYLRPQELVQLGVKTNILGEHGLLGELLNGLDGTRSTTLESTSFGQAIFIIISI